MNQKSFVLAYSLFPLVILSYSLLCLSETVLQTWDSIPHLILKPATANTHLGKNVCQSDLIPVD